MSRLNTTGTNPETLKPVKVSYGYDSLVMVPGYFIQVYDKNAVSDTNDEGIICEEGMAEGLNKQEILKLIRKYDVKIPQKYYDQIMAGFPILEEKDSPPFIVVEADNFEFGDGGEDNEEQDFTEDLKEEEY